MAQFNEYNPFLPERKDTPDVVEIRRSRQKQEDTRQEVQLAIADKCRQIGGVQLPLFSVRRKSA